MIEVQKINLSYCREAVTVAQLKYQPFGKAIKSTHAVGRYHPEHFLDAWCSKRSADPVKRAQSIMWNISKAGYMFLMLAVKLAQTDANMAEYNKN